MPIANKLRSASSEEDPKIYELFSVDAYKGEDTTPKLLLHEDLDIAGNPTTIWTKKNNDAGTTKFVVNSPDIMGYSQYLALGDHNGSQTYSIINDIPSTGGIRFNGGSTGGQSGDWANFNHTDYTYSSYAFREHPKFFSEVSYIGTEATKTISHGLKDDLGMAIFKNRIDGDWIVWHKDMGTDQSSGNYYHKVAYLNKSYPPESSSVGGVMHWGGNTTQVVDNSAGTFKIGNGTTSTGSDYLKINVSGQSHIAWFFPDNEYVKCGKLDTQGFSFGSYGYQVDLGFEPQFVLIKNIYMNGDWRIWDRYGAGSAPGNGDFHLIINALDSYTNQQRSTQAVEDEQIFFNARGFSIKQGTNDFSSSASNAGFIYMAVRKDDEPRPKDNLQKRIFGYAANLETYQYSDGVPFPHPYINNFKPDFAFYTKAQDGWHKGMIGNKIGNSTIYLNSAITSWSAYGSSFGDRSNWWYKKGFGYDFTTNNSPFMYMWKCTKGVCDHQIYRNNEDPIGTTYTVKHNLGAVPELMIFKRLLNNTNDPVYLYHKGISQDGTYLDKLDGNTLTISNYNSGQSLNNYNPTDTQFQVKDIGSNGALGHNDYYYVWLFASYPGVSKIGTVDVNTSSVVYIGNGFPSSSKLFVMWRKIKDTSGNFVQSVWKMASSDRGINMLGTTAEAVTLVVTEDSENNSGDYFNVDSSSGEAKVGFTISPLIEGAGTYAYMIFAYTD